jgi:hypothetical protein
MQPETICIYCQKSGADAVVRGPGHPDWPCHLQCFREAQVRAYYLSKEPK